MINCAIALSFLAAFFTQCYFLARTSESKKGKREREREREKERKERKKKQEEEEDEDEEEEETLRPVRSLLKKNPHYRT